MLTLKPGVSDDATYNEYGAAGGPAGPGPVAAIAPEPVRKADVISLDDLREFVAKDKGWAPGPNAGWRRLDEPEDDHMPAVGQGFNAWREGLWEGVKQGKTFKDQPALYRAMSEGEYQAGMEAGAFRPLMGDDLYVTDDPDRLAGGAYGGKGGGYIVQFSADLPTRHAGSRTLADLDELVVSEIPTDQITAVYRWDPDRADHVRVPLEVLKAKWAPGPNAMWRRLDDEPEARVPEHLRDRVASSLNSMNLLIRPEWEAVMTDRGLSEDAIVEANRLLNAWGSNKAQQERAAAEILEHLAHKDEVARTIQAASQLEEDAWAIWTEAHPDASAFIYRKGSALTKDIEAWTRNYHGAWMGNAGHIGWDAQLPFTLEAIHSKGYSILAGVNRGVGAPGEQEITLIRTEHLYPGTDVRKDKGWAPGPNAGWKRRDSGSTAVAERPASTAYRIIHQPRKESGARADDLSLVRADVYEHPEWYGGDEYPEMVPIVEAMRGNPDMRLTVYRAVPMEGAGPNYGDWVTPVRHYAEHHGEILAGMGEAAEGETFKILEKEVAVRDLVWPGDYLPEFGWFPERVQKDKGWMPGPNAMWRRLDDRPKGPDLPVCRPPNLKDFDAYATARGELLDYAVASEIEADENGSSPTDWLRDGMQNLGEEWGKDFKVLVQERLYRRLEDDEAFRRMVADRMGLSPDQVGPESMKATVRDMVDTWAKTSGDSNVEALLIQEAARQEFGLTNARTKDLDLMAEASKGLPDSAVTWTPEKYQRYTATLESPEFDGYRSFVRAQYDETQDFLERAGIEEVLVYRGGGVPADTVPDFPEGDRYVAGYVHLRQNPLTSWSTDTATASDFQVAHLESQAPATFATVVPRGRILATPATGVGCLREAEVVVLGGETPAFMIAGPDSVWHNFDSEILMYDERTLGPHRFWPQTIPEGAGDDERK